MVPFFAPLPADDGVLRIPALREAVQRGLGLLDPEAQEFLAAVLVDARGQIDRLVPYGATVTYLVVEVRPARLLLAEEVLGVHSVFHQFIEKTVDLTGGSFVSGHSTSSF